LAGGFDYIHAGNDSVEKVGSQTRRAVEKHRRG
jgi:hypothetical protein